MVPVLLCSSLLSVNSRIYYSVDHSSHVRSAKYVLFLYSISVLRVKPSFFLPFFFLFHDGVRAWVLHGYGVVDWESIAKPRC